MKPLFLIIFTVVSAQNMEIFDPGYLEHFNPLRIYRDPFQFDDSSSSSDRIDAVPNSDFILPRILDKMFGYDDQPRDSISYAPTWFKM